MKSTIIREYREGYADKQTDRKIDGDYVPMFIKREKDRETDRQTSR
jgi:hypothetical protein